MARKAKLVFFSDVDIAYGKKYGIMPDYHHVQLLEKGVHPDVAAYLINTRMRLIWNKMKYEHEHGLPSDDFVSVQKGAYIPF